MNEFGPFRLIDRILKYEAGECIATRTDLSIREELQRSYSYQSILVEIAAQSCALLVRLDSDNRRESFLGKVGEIVFPNAASAPVVLARARVTGESGEIVAFQGEMRSLEGESLAEFDLIIGTAANLGGDSGRRTAYWRSYLDSLATRRNNEPPGGEGRVEDVAPHALAGTGERY